MKRVSPGGSGLYLFHGVLGILFAAAQAAFVYAEQRRFAFAPGAARTIFHPAMLGVAAMALASLAAPVLRHRLALQVAGYVGVALGAYNALAGAVMTLSISPGIGPVRLLVSVMLVAWVIWLLSFRLPAGERQEIPPH